MVNSIRGEVSAQLAGREMTLCLTLGALACLESRFNCADLISLIDRLQSGRLKADDLIDIIHAGLMGGGNEISRAEVAAIKIEGGVEGAVRLTADLIRAAFPPPINADEGAAE